MVFARRLGWFVLVFCIGVNAWALDPGTAVQVVPLMKTGSTWDGQPITYPQGKAEVTAMKVEVAPGAETGWHTHSVPSFAVMLEGRLEVHLQDGRIKHLQAGDVLAEVVNTLHVGRNVGEVPVRLVVFYTGVAGVPHSAKAQPVAVGADRDAKGCIGSAGYTWCAREKACVRPWELAKQRGFESGATAFERFCASAPE